MRDLTSIVVDAGRVLRSGWVGLIAVFLLGYSARSLFLYGAVSSTRLSPYLGRALLPFAPLALLLALVVMLRIGWRALPGHVFRPEPFGRLLAEDLRLGTSLMIPFVAVYASAGLLREDNLAFQRGIFLEEQATNGVWDADLSRYDWLTGWDLAVAVGAALVVRWALLISGLPRRSWGWAAVGAYVEALWVATLASALQDPIRDFLLWFQRTRLGDLIITAYQQVVSLLGPFDPIVRASVSWMAQNAVAIFALVFLPLAWLAIGQTASDAEHDLPGQPQPGARWGVWQSRTARVVERARQYRVTQPVWEPLSDLTKAVRHILVAGWVPMLSFAVLFYLAGQLRVLVAFTARLILGPQPYGEYVSTKPFVVLIELLVYSTVIVALVTGAVRLVDIAAARANAVRGAGGNPPPGWHVQGAAMGNTAIRGGSQDT